MKRWKIVYIVFFFVLCLIPFVFLPLKGEEASSENRELSEIPSLVTEEGVNKEWLSQLGDYFQEHFAFRNELVTANALIQGKVLGVSTASGVIQGSDGWLYYKDSLADYQGTDLLSSRSLFNLAHTMGMTERALRAKGVDFVFAVAPNKNSLYGEHMPYYYKMKVTEDNNISHLIPLLEQEGVTFTDLFTVFRDQDEVLYHKRDSHWNNKGAALAADSILNTLGKEHVSCQGEDYTTKKDFDGDLDQMLYPLAMTPEEEIYFDPGPSFTYVEEVESNFAPRISTTAAGKTGSLVVYRDSFGNALLPFLAGSYGQAYFSRGVPYQLTDVEAHQADTVMIVRAERFLPEMVSSPPAMEAMAVAYEGQILEPADAGGGAADLVLKNQGLLKQISGRILPGYLDDQTRIFVRIDGNALYEAFPMDLELPDGSTDPGGFCLYVRGDTILADGTLVEVFRGDESSLELIHKEILKEVVPQ